MKHRNRPPILDACLFAMSSKCWTCCHCMPSCYPNWTGHWHTTGPLWEDVTPGNSGLVKTGTHLKQDSVPSRQGVPQAEHHRKGIANLDWIPLLCQTIGPVCHQRSGCAFSEMQWLEVGACRDSTFLAPDNFLPPIKAWSKPLLPKSGVQIQTPQV